MMKAGRLRKLLEQTGQGRQNGHPDDMVRPLHDDTAPAEGLSLTQPELLVVADMQSYPGQRTVRDTREVINQYVVAANPRYAPRPGLSEAGHLFVFDVMNSLRTSLGTAFRAGPSSLHPFRPGTLAEMWKWLNETARTQGWRVVEGSALLEALRRGLPVIALAETPTGPRLAVGEPGPPGPDGKPRLASAYKPRGQGQTPQQVFGTSAVRYLAHD